MADAGVINSPGVSARETKIGQTKHQTVLVWLHLLHSPCVTHLFNRGKVDPVATQASVASPVSVACCRAWREDLVHATSVGIGGTSKTTALILCIALAVPVVRKLTSLRTSQMRIKMTHVTR